ncbi:MAG: hypothetical protein NZ950_03090 [Candidatus Aenigmarchaeota archaeon]|nr:hypothetical protein [Candidatus Aenigmarchaeota archaeon]
MGAVSPHPYVNKEIKKS